MRRKALVSFTVLAMIFGLSVTAAAYQSTPEAGDQGVEGAWVVTVAVEGTGVFPIFQTYEAGGTVTSEGLPAFRADPAAGVDTLYISTGVGAWESTGPGAYSATIAIMYGDVDGNVLAIETVWWDFELDETGNAWSGPSTFIGVDPTGATLYEGTATVTGSRITVQEPGVPVMVPVGGATPVATPAG